MLSRCLPLYVTSFVNKLILFSASCPLVDPLMLATSCPTKPERQPKAKRLIQFICTSTWWQISLTTDEFVVLTGQMLIMFDTTVEFTDNISTLNERQWLQTICNCEQPPPSIIFVKLIKFGLSIEIFITICNGIIADKATDIAKF